MTAQRISTTYSDRSGFTSTQGIQGTTVYKFNTGVYYEFHGKSYDLSRSLLPWSQRFSFAAKRQEKRKREKEAAGGEAGESFGVKASVDS